MAPRNTSGSVAAAVAAAAVVAGASAQSWSIPTFPAGGFTMPTFSGVPAFNPASLPSLPTFPGFPDIPSWMVASTIATETGMEIPSIPSVPAFGEFSFPTLNLNSTMLDIVGMPERLEGVAQLPVADVLAIEGMDYGAFVEGYTQMVDAWTPAMAGATFSG